MATNSQHQETPEYRTFQEHYARLYHAIQNPLSLATQLFTKSVVDSSILQQMSTLGFTTFQNTNTLLSAVLGKIQADPSVFVVFLSALKEDPSMQLLVESMERELSSGAHGGDESRDGGEEQEKNSMSVLEELSLCGESMTLPRHVDHQHYQHHHHHLQRHPQQQKQYFNHSSSQPPSKSLYHAPFHPPSLQVWHHPPNQHKPIQPHMYQSPNYLPLGQPCSEHRDPIQPLYYQPSHHPPNPPFLQHSHQPLLQHTHSPTSQSLSQQLHYHPHYQMPVQPMYMYPPHLSSPSLSEHAFQLNHWTSIFQSSQMPSSHCYHTPFYPFYQASFQTPAQPVNAYQSSSPLSPPPHLVSCPDPTLSRGKGSGDH